MAEIAHQHNADVVTLKVLHHALQAAGELKHLARHDVRKTRYTADAVAESHDGSRLEHVDLAVCCSELISYLLRNGQALFVAHERIALNVTGESVELMRERSVVDGVADLHTDAAYKLAVYLVAAAYKGLAQYAGDALHLLVGERLCALY